MPEQICKNCRYWEENEKLAKGKCRRYPPVQMPGFMFAFPETKPADYCGEFNVKEK